MDSDQKYTLLIDTLNLVLLPNKEFGVPYDDLLLNQLEELEGDSYTFLHSANIGELVRNELLNSSVACQIEQIRQEVKDINRELWNPKDFMFSDEWNEIRTKVLKLVSELN